MVNIQCIGFTCNGSYFRNFFTKNGFTISTNDKSINNLFIDFVDFNNIQFDHTSKININDSCNLILYVYSSIHEWISTYLKSNKKLANIFDYNKIVKYLLQHHKSCLTTLLDGNYKYIMFNSLNIEHYLELIKLLKLQLPRSIYNLHYKLSILDLSIISDKEWILDVNAFDDRYTSLSYDYILQYRQHSKLAHKFDQKHNYHCYYDDNDLKHIANSKLLYFPLDSHYIIDPIIIHQLLYYTPNDNISYYHIHNNKLVGIIHSVTSFKFKNRRTIMLTNNVNIVTKINGKNNSIVYSNFSNFDIKQKILDNNQTNIQITNIYSSIDEYMEDHLHDKYIFYTMANSPAIDLVVNFIKSAKLNNLNPVIFALDNQILDKLSNYGVNIIKWSNQYDQMLTQNNIDTFKHMMFNKFKITTMLLKYFKILIYSDSDVYVNYDISDLVDTIENDTIYDIYIQSNLNNSCCTGFFIVKSNTNTINMFDIDESEVMKYDYGDQQYFNNVIFLKLNTKKLPILMFPNGQFIRRFRNTYNDQYRLLHFNTFTEIKSKIDIMKKLGYYLN